MELINNVQADILEHLGRFGFVAVSQFRLLTGKSVGYLREMLGSLSRKGYIKSFVVTVTHKVRAENMYYLTPQGKEFLLSHKNAFADDLKLPLTANPVVVKDYFHRYNTVSVHIALYQCLTAQHNPLLYFYTYFDKVSKKGMLMAKTIIPLDGKDRYIPDCVMRTQEALYLIEIYCDRDTKRIIFSLATHAKAIALGTPGKAFDIKANPFVLAVFEHKATKQNIIKKLQSNEDFTPMSKLFFFASLDDVKKNAMSAFTDIYNNNLSFT